MQTPRTLPADWEKVLARVEQALGEAVTRLQEREQEWMAPAPLAAAPQALDFSKFEQRLALFAKAPQQADQRTAELDTALRDGEDNLRQWLARAEAARRQLAAWAGRA
ncbi:MAG TPA: hypothetical protein VE988_18645 [Gemmataceae bacterium]|nr:hypothetical protein [Gemmataceae bacterium]